MARKVRATRGKSQARSSVTHKNKHSNVPQHSNAQHSNVPQQSSSVLGNIGQGITFGAGAAIGNSMINSTIDAFSKPNENQNQTLPTNQNKCDELINNFQECMKNTSNESMCTPYINMFNECIKNRI